MSLEVTGCSLWVSSWSPTGLVAVVTVLVFMTCLAFSAGLIA
ncbi:hypothetical protein [Streptomyces sp. NPDC085665]